MPGLSPAVALARRDTRLPGDTGWLATAARRLAQRFTDSWRASVTGDWS